MSNPYDPDAANTPHLEKNALESRISDAVQSGTLEDVKSAVAMGANPRQRDDELIVELAKNTPENQGAILAYLIDQGCDINAYSGTLIKTAIKNHNNDLLEVLLNDYAPDLNIMGGTYIDGNITVASPLTFALFAKNTAAVEWLIKRGAEHNTVGDNALKLACNLLYTDAVKALLKTGVYDLSQNENEALFSACLSGRLKNDPDFDNGQSISDSEDTGVVDTLLDYGADPNDRGRNLFWMLHNCGRKWLSKHIQARIDKTLEPSISLPDGFFDTADLSDIREKGDYKGQHASGFVHAARAGQFDRIIKLIKSAPKDADIDDRTLYPMDLLYCDDRANRVLDYLAAQGQLDLAFDPTLWIGRSDQVQALYEMLNEDHKVSVDIKTVLQKTLVRQTDRNRPRLS